MINVRGGSAVPPTNTTIVGGAGGGGIALAITESTTFNEAVSLSLALCSIIVIFQPKNLVFFL